MPPYDPPLANVTTLATNRVDTKLPSLLLEATPCQYLLRGVCNSTIKEKLSQTLPKPR